MIDRFWLVVPCGPGATINQAQQVLNGGREGEREALQVIGTEQLINLHAQAAEKVPGSPKPGMDEATQLLVWQGRGLLDPSGPWVPLHQIGTLPSSFPISRQHIAVVLSFNPCDRPVRANTLLHGGGHRGSERLSDVPRVTPW